MKTNTTEQITEQEETRRGESIVAGMSKDQIRRNLCALIGYKP